MKTRPMEKRKERNNCCYQSLVSVTMRGVLGNSKHAVSSISISCTLSHTLYSFSS